MRAPPTEVRQTLRPPPRSGNTVSPLAAMCPTSSGALIRQGMPSHARPQTQTAGQTGGDDQVHTR